MERQLKRIHTQLQTLRQKEARGVKLSSEEQSQLKQLAEERDALASQIVFHTPNPSPPR